MIPAWTKGVVWLGLAVGVGFAGGVAYERQRIPAPAVAPMDPVRVMHVLDSVLELDAVQHAAINAVMTRRQAAIDSAWKALRPLMKEAVDSTQFEVARLLRPDQAKKFAEFMRTSHPARPAPRPETTKP